MEETAEIDNFHWKAVSRWFLKSYLLNQEMYSKNKQKTQTLSLITH